MLTNCYAVRREITFSLLFAILCFCASGQNCFLAVNTSESVNSYVNNVKFLGLQVKDCSQIDSIIFILDESNFADEVNYIIDELINAKSFYKPYKILTSDDLYYQMNPNDGLSSYGIANSKAELVSQAVRKYICKLDLLECSHELTLDSVLLDRKGIKLSTLNSTFAYFESDSLFLLVSDIDNNIYLMNSNSGKAVRQFDTNKLNGYDLFCKHFAENESECQLATKGESNLRKIRRHRIPIYKLNTYKGKIYAGCGLQVLVKLKEEFKYFDDRMKPGKLAKGSPFYWQYSVILEFDSLLNLKKTYGIDENSMPDSLLGQYLAGVDYGFDFVNDSTLVTFSTPNAIFDISTNDPVLSFYRLEGDKLTYQNGSRKSFPKNYEEREFWCYNAYVLNHNSGIIFNLPVYNSFSITNPKTMETLGNFVFDKSYQDTNANIFSKYAQDSTSANIDFFVLDMFSNDNDIKSLYRVKDSLFFKGKNKLHNLTELDGLPEIDFQDFDEGNCVITDSQILIILKNKSGYVLYKIRYDS